MVDGGGCSGFQYIIKLEDSALNENDVIINHSDMKVVVDKESIPFLEGAKLEHIDTLIKSGFQIIENPNSEQNCSCGSSFSPKLKV